MDRCRVRGAAPAALAIAAGALVAAGAVGVLFALSGSFVVARPAAPAAPREALTIERIFSDPPLDGDPPRELRWLPGGERYSYLERTGPGADAPRRLVVVDAASGTVQRVVDEHELAAPGASGVAGPKLSGYAWSPRGDVLLLEGGGDLYLAVPGVPGVPGARRLTSAPGTGEHAQFSPDGRWIAFVRDSDLYAVDVASGHEVRLSTDGGGNRVNGAFDWLYGEELTEADTRAFAWSPDSRSIVYLTLDESRAPRFPITDLLPPQPVTTEQTYPRAGDPNPVPELRVVTIVPGEPAAARTTVDLRFADDSIYLPRLGWTPDGRAVWYERLDRAQTRLDLLRVDVATGAGTTLVSDHDAAWVNLHDDLFFLRDGRFTWSSEESGFRHLYLHDAAGKRLRALTSGSWDVIRAIAVDETGGSIVFEADAGGPLERQLYRAGLDGGKPVRLTEEPGVHSVQASTPPRFFLDTWSRAGRPPSIRLLDGSGKRLRSVYANEHPPIEAYADAPLEFHEIKGPGGVTLHASLRKPAGFDPHRKYPVLVYVYGGPGPGLNVVRDGWGGRYTLFHQYMANLGMLVFSVDNRGTAGRGRDFERAIAGRLGKAELDDQLAALAWLRSQPFVDGSRVGIWGWSYGGFMTLYAMTHTDVFRAGAAVAPVTDWRYYDSAYTERYLRLPASNAEGYAESSPVTHADRLHGAVLLVHGTGDDNVHWQNTLAFVDRLCHSGVRYDLQLYPNLSHGIGGKEARIHLHRRIAEHFLRELLPEREVPAAAE